MYVFSRHLQEDYGQKACENLQYVVCIGILSYCIFYLFCLNVMVDPFASTSPTDPKQQPNKNNTSSNDVFGWVPDIFADMAATAFQPIDPETGRPTEHTPETLDPFLRDDLSVSSDVDMSNTIVSNDVFPIDETKIVDEAPSQYVVVNDPVDVAEDLPSTETLSQEQISQEEKSSQPIEETTEQETVTEEYRQDVDIETPSYFETALSFDDESNSLLSETVTPEEFNPDSVQELKSSDPVSDHYDPFVDDVNDKPDNNVDNDDPFLQDTIVEEEGLDVVIKDPFLEDAVLQPTDQINLQDKEEDLVPEEKDLIGDPFLDEQISPITEEVIEPSFIEEPLSPDYLNIVDNKSPLDQSDVVSWSDDSLSMWQDREENLETKESIVAKKAISLEDPVVADEDTFDSEKNTIQSPEEEVASVEEPSVIEESVDDVDGGLHSLDDERTEEPQNSIELELPAVAEDLVNDTLVTEDTPEKTEAAPSMVQWLVEGIFDPFMSTKPSSEDVPENEIVADIEHLEAPVDEKKSDDVVLEEDSDLWPVASTTQEEFVDEEIVEEEIVDEPTVSEPAVAEEEQDMQKTWLSDVFIKFQELLQRIYRVHDNRGGHDSFSVVGADNDALYITYSFAIEASVEQAIIITKEFTDRKDDDSIDTHILRFGINPSSLVEVYVDGVLLFVEDQLVDNVKAKMQLMDKFNKFIFLIDQFIQDSANQASWNAIASAQEEFGWF